MIQIDWMLNLAKNCQFKKTGSSDISFTVEPYQKHVKTFISNRRAYIVARKFSFEIVSWFTKLKILFCKTAIKTSTTCTCLYLLKMCLNFQ